MWDFFAYMDVLDYNWLKTPIHGFPIGIVIGLLFIAFTIWNFIGLKKSIKEKKWHEVTLVSILYPMMVIIIIMCLGMTGLLIGVDKESRESVNKPFVVDSVYTHNYIDVKGKDYNYHIEVDDTTKNSTKVFSYYTKYGKYLGHTIDTTQDIHLIKGDTIHF